MTHAPVLTAPAPRSHVARVDVEHLRRDAVATLLRNWRGSSTVPTATLYPHQWSWDSAFIAIGLAHISSRRAWSELFSLFGAQWGDGRVPQIVFNPSVPKDAYFPGPPYWKPLPAGGPVAGVSTTGLVQPPVHAAAALSVVRHTPHDEVRPMVQRIYPALAAYHDYLFSRRMLPSGLVAIVHPWESGCDNSPSWDAPLDAVTAGIDDIATLRRDLDHVSRSARPTDQEYARYMLIASTYRDTGYRDDDLVSLPFCVVDPLFNALLVWSERALADIARLADQPAQHHLDRAAALSAAMHQQLFDDDLGSYVAVDARTGHPSRVRTVGGLAPLLLSDLPGGHRRALMRTLSGPSFLVDGAAYGVPSYDLTAGDVDPYRYWRGPTWINTSWLLRAALRDAGEYARALRLTESMLGLVTKSGFREYFHPWTGEGLGASDFSWSAALVLDVLHDLESADGHRQR